MFKSACALLLGLGLQAEAMIGGRGGEYPEVVQIRSAREVCSGTIVGPRAVLTAAHCADLPKASLVFKGKKYPLTFASSADFKKREHDVAVAMTDRPIMGASFGVIGSGLRHGRTLWLAGYGCRRTGGTAGGLRAGISRVVGMDEDHVLSVSSSGGVLCPGDSGGPAFVQEKGRRIVVGINSASDVRRYNLNVRLDSRLSRGFLAGVAGRFKLDICGVSARCR